MPSLLDTARASDDVLRVAEAADDLDGLVERLLTTAAQSDDHAAELARRRETYAAGNDAARGQFEEHIRRFAARVVGGNSNPKSPASPQRGAELDQAVVVAFEMATQDARERAERGRELAAHGGNLARATDLTGAVLQLSDLLEDSTPLVKRFVELRDAAGPVARFAAPVLRDEFLDAWAPIFQDLLGSRAGFDTDGRCFALGWIHRAGIPLPEHVAEIDEGKRRVSVARGVDGQPRLDDQVAAFKADADNFLRNDAT